MDPRIDAPDEDPESDTWTCDACGASARYLTRDPWIDQDGRRLCGRCAAPGPERKREGDRPPEAEIRRLWRLADEGDQNAVAHLERIGAPPPPPPTLAGHCDVCGAQDDAVYTVETTESALKWGGTSEILTLCEGCFEKGEGR